MNTRIVVLGAGFGGLELCTILSEAIGDKMDLTLIDKSDSFVFGFSKIDILFGGATADAVRIEYRKISKPGVRFRQEIIRAIDPVARRVTTDHGVYDADILVVALGADYDTSATPGLAEGTNEFYTVKGAEHTRDLLRDFSKGNLVVGVCSLPFKCPPAPTEAALMLHDYLTEHKVRDSCHIALVMPFATPIPPSPDASRTLEAAFAERDIKFVPRRSVSTLDSKRRVIVLDDMSEMPCDLFLGIPRHRVPDVVEASGMTEDGWIPVNPANLSTRFAGVYAVGDVTELDVPKAGFFAEGAARVAAMSIIADLKDGPRPAAYDGSASCYIEWGSKGAGRVDLNFLSGPSVTSKFAQPSMAIAAEKRDSALTRRKRWFND